MGRIAPTDAWGVHVRDHFRCGASEPYVAREHPLYVPFPAPQPGVCGGCDLIAGTRDWREYGGFHAARSGPTALAARPASGTTGDFQGGGLAARRGGCELWIGLHLLLSAISGLQRSSAWAPVDG